MNNMGLNTPVHLYVDCFNKYVEKFLEICYNLKKLTHKPYSLEIFLKIKKMLGMS